MYRAKLHPEQRASDLDIDQVTSLHQAIIYISETAVAANSDSSLFPKDWLFHCRWESRVPKKRTGSGGGGPITTADGHKVEFIKVGGRTTAFVPSVQKKK